MSLADDASSTHSARPAVPAVPMRLAHERLLNRELSWLDFNARVLEEAEDPTVPLLDRVKFLSIVSSNWDEFFMVRVAGIWRQIDADIKTPGPDGYTPRQTLQAISERIHQLSAYQHQLFHQILVPELAREGIRILSPEDLLPEQKAYLSDYFDQVLQPLLTPLAVDPGHPFPRLGNRAPVLVAQIEPEGDTLFGGLPVSRLSFIHVPSTLVSRFLLLPSAAGTYDFVTLEDFVRYHLDRVFPGYTILSCHMIRVTRDSDLPVEEDSEEDLMKVIEEGLRDRRRGAVVRLQYERDLPLTLLDFLREELELAPEDLYPTDGVAAFSDLFSLYNQVQAPHLKDPVLQPLPVPQLEESGSIFEAMARQDILLHHPYQSFDQSVVRFVREAAEDPKVLAIKVTLYRMTQSSPVAAALELAAERGKQVTAIIELRARFDEEANIAWARRLEKAGVYVVYGLPRFKTHCKACLVLRQEATGFKRYCHLGTGNYNEKTSRLYSDLGILTACPEIGEDLSAFFNFLTGYTRPARYHRLVVGPLGLRPWLREGIQREISHAREGRPASLTFKMNALVDPTVVEQLYEASQAGVKVDLIVRGTCCLRPEVPGLSENIRVVSVIDRFLEHARVYHFHNGGQEQTYLASADLMPRNLDRRVELAFPVVDPILQYQVREMLDWQLQDSVKGRRLDSGGQPRPRATGGPHCGGRSQLRLYDQAVFQSGIKAVTQKLPDLR